ncbi:MAG: RNA-guided endonuclease InsQ/TnpB family protein [Janthinobacterium lividum]
MNRSCLKIRLYPDRAQERELETTLETCRLVYNSLVNDRKFQYDTAQVSVSRYAQQAYLPQWKKDHPELKAVYSQVLQDVVHRVDLAFKAFFERVAKGETPGFPRFKGLGQYDSITFTQNDSFKVRDSTLRLAKIGQVKAKLHRRPWGELKTCTVHRINGKWFACLCQEIEAEHLPPSEEAIGIDVGLKTFAALSNSEFIENPRFFRKEEKALAKANRKLAKQKRRSRERKKARKVISRIHERIRNRRHDFCHQNARRIVNRFGVIAVEKLNIKGMVKNHSLAKSISDAAWSQFRLVLTSKAESAGREILAINPAYTSQDCSGCGYRPDGLEGRTKKKLSDRWHLCPMCGLSVDRDTNAAINILALGQQSLASGKA